MKKFTQKIILLMSMALLFVTIPFALTACDFGGKHEHSFTDWYDGCPATCYSSGQKGYYYCTTCHKRFDADKTTEIYDTYIDISDHQLRYHEAKAPTCSDAGHSEYWECTVCKEIFLDGFGDQPGSEYDIRIDPTHEHDLVHAHDYVAPTCTEAGCREYWECRNCRNWFGSNGPDPLRIYDKNAVIIPAQHINLTEHREQSAWCTTEGTKKYWECDDCGKKFSDSDCTKEITDDSELVIPARGHNTTYIEAKENTHSTSGCIAHWKCTRCSRTFADEEATQSINATIKAGHNFDENGQCKYCDQEEYSAGLTFKLLEESDTYQVNCKGFTQGDLVIPAKYTDTKTGAVAKDVTRIAGACDLPGITSVTIPKTIKTIVADAFKNCTGLTAVYYKGTIEDWIKISFESIYSNPLYYAKKLYLLDEEAGEYNLLTTLTLFGENAISAYAFAGCTSLTSITADKASIGTSAFADCTNLESISLPFYTLAQLFGDGQIPSSLKTITYTRANGITELDSKTFSTHYGNVENLTIPDGIEKIDYDTFKYFTNLKTIILPDTISLFYRSFTNCTNLQYNEYDNGLYLGTKNNKYAYLIKAKSTNITSLIVHTNCLAVSSYALEGCTKLTSLTTPFSGVSLAMASTTDSSLSGFQHWFGDLATANIKQLIFSKDSLEKVWVNIPSLTSITLPTQVKSITLRNCSHLTNLTIPDSTTSLSVKSCYAKNLTMPWLSNLVTIVSALSAQNVTITKNNSTTTISDSYFSDISSLETIVLPAGIKTIGESAFKKCTALTSITIPNSVTSLGASVFSGCTSLKSIDIPNNVTSINDYTFYGCTSLESITIPNSVTGIGDYTFYGCTALTSVTIPNSVTGIGDYTFYGCTALTSVIIPNSVTSIGEYAFSGCTALTNVTISTNVTSIGKHTFDDCHNLTSINIPSSVTSIGEYAFYDCTSLTSVTIPSSVTSIENHAFYSCTALTIYCEAESQPSEWNSYWNNISYKDTDYCPVVWNCNSNDVATNGNIYTVVNGIRYTVKDGTATLVRQPSNLTDVVLPSSISYKDSTYNVTSIGEYAFYDHKNLTNITIGDNVTIIEEYAFRDCTALTSITIPNSVKSIGKYAFYGCTSLESVTISSGVTSTGSYVFSDCTALARVNYLGTIDQWAQISFDTDSNPLSYAKEGLFINDTLVTEVNFTTATTIYNFENYDKLTSVTIGDSVTSIGGSAFYGCTGLTDITIPDSVTSIGSYAFYGCTSLESVTIGKNVTSIGSSAFRRCSALTGITIPESVTSIGEYAFASCTALTSVNIPNNVTSVEKSVFLDCTSLTSITIPSNVTSIGEYAFEGCTRLTSITIPSSVTSIYKLAFYGCYAITIYCEATSRPSGWSSDWNYTSCPVVWNCNSNDIAEDGNIYTIIDGIRYALNDGKATVLRQSSNITNAEIQSTISYSDSTYTVTNIAKQAFYDCTALTSITIPNSVKSIGIYAFEGCTALTSVTIPNSVTTMGGYTFAGCTSLECVTIGNNVTSIELYTFSGCSALTTITIGSGITSTGALSFEDCISITRVNYNGTIDQWAQIEFDGENDNPLTYAKHLYINNSLVTEANLTTATKIGKYAFANYDKLTSVTIGDNVTTIGKYAFHDCTSLENVTIGNNVTSIGEYAFYGCTSLKNVTIGNNVTNIAGGAFGSCTALTEVNYLGTIDQWVQISFYNEYANPLTHAKNLYINNSLVTEANLTTATKIGQYAFAHYDKLTSVTIGDNVTTIGNHAFLGCSALRSVTIPNSVTTIEASAFCNCTALTSITIPNSVTTIKYYVFKGCTALTIYCEATSRPSGWDSGWNNSYRPVIWGYTAD